MALNSREMAMLEGLLTGASSIPMGAFGKGGGVRGSDIEDSLRMLLNDPEFVDEFVRRGGRMSDLEDEIAGLKGKRGKTAERLKKIRKGVGKKGLAAAAGGIGGKLLVGGGILGTALMAMDILSGAKESSNRSSDSMRSLRGRRDMDFAENLSAITGPREMDRLKASRQFRKQATGTAGSMDKRMSAELRSLLSEGQAQELGRMRQQMKPGIREAYARVGLVA
jgi:hypothetical protein|tara:strand:- start:2348 stop:3016 length:669 start_codon:yes stop_codon:yes gene_type:complete